MDGTGSGNVSARSASSSAARGHGRRCGCSPRVPQDTLRNTTQTGESYGETALPRLSFTVLSTLNNVFSGLSLGEGNEKKKRNSISAE